MPSDDQCIRFTSAQHAELIETARPDAPLAPDEIIGRTLYTLISPGTELAMYERPAETFSPFNPGYAAVFEVEAVGSDVRDVRAGDRVFSMGNHQSFQRAKRSAVIPIPGNMSPQLAVFARLMGVTMSTLTTTAARPPAKVLVTGLGPVGHLGAKIFAASGYEVLACDPVESRRELLVRENLCEVVAGIPTDDARWKDQIELDLECSGHEQAVLDACRIVRKGGEVVLVGVPWKRRTEIYASELLHAVFHRYITLRSGWEWELPLHATDFLRGSIFGNLEGALRWLAEGRVKIPDGLFSVRSPSDPQAIYQDLMHNKQASPTVVLDWTTL